MAKNKHTKNTSSNVKKNNRVFSRITLVLVLGVFVLLGITMLLTTGAMSLIAKYWHVNEDNIVVFGVVILAISICIGVSLSFAYSAIMVKTVQPYLEALQKIGECDFSVRIGDKPILSGLGVADNINNLAKQLESVETLREDFVTNFSHEFKTPIVSIYGFAKLLKSPNLSAEDRNEYLDVIIDESNRLVSLSESVLMLSRLDSQTIVNESFLLDEQIRQSLLLFERACEGKNIEIDADLEEIAVVNSKKLLSQIWVNLLSNAVKFTPNGGKIKVSAKRMDNDVCVVVKDNGCGMNEDTVKNIFNKFYQGDKSHSTEGNGLGLPIVKKICDLLKIKISVQSEVGKGSTFSVMFNVEPAVKNNTLVTKQTLQQGEAKN